jgi:TonB family protein
MLRINRKKRTGLSALFAATMMSIVGYSVVPDNSPPNEPIVPKNRSVAVLTPVAPIFPVNLLKRKISGEAEVEFIIDRNGDVTKAQVLSASHKEFGLASVECILKWKFIPNIKNGRLTTCRCTQRFYFDGHEGEQPKGVPEPASKADPKT